MPLRTDNLIDEDDSDYNDEVDNVKTIFDINKYGENNIESELYPGFEYELFQILGSRADDDEHATVGQAESVVLARK